MPWVTAQLSDRNALENFIVDHEYFACSLSHRLLDSRSKKICIPSKNRAIIFLHYAEKLLIHINSLLYIDNFGFAFIILNFKSNDLNTPYFQELYKMAAPHIMKIFSCMGRARDCEQFIKLLKLKPNHNIHYRMMVKHRNSYTQTVDQNLQIHRASQKDFEKLFPLHLSYIKEEVLLPYTQLNIHSSKNHFLYILEHEIVYFIEINTMPIAKVQTNAQGIHFDQIGGMYTSPHFRNRGYASKLVQYISTNILNSGKFISLYVKTTNTQAISLYIHNGFTVCSDLMVFYLHAH